MTRPILLGLLLAACGGAERSADDDDGTSTSATTSATTSTGSGSLGDGYMRATLLLTAGGERLLDVGSRIQTSDTIHTCEGTDDEGWGVGVAWERGAPPAVGEYTLEEFGSYPEIIVAFPKPSGGYRFKFVQNGLLTITTAEADLLEGTFGGITFTPDDADDIVAGVPQGAFRCEGTL